MPVQPRRLPGSLQPQRQGGGDQASCCPGGVVLGQREDPGAQRCHPRQGSQALGQQTTPRAEGRRAQHGRGSHQHRQFEACPAWDGPIAQDGNLCLNRGQGQERPPQDEDGGLGSAPSCRQQDAGHEQVGLQECRSRSQGGSSQVENCRDPRAALQDSALLQVSRPTQEGCRTQQEPEEAPEVDSGLFRATQGEEKPVPGGAGEEPGGDQAELQIRAVDCFKGGWLGGAFSLSSGSEGQAESHQEHAHESWCGVSQDRVADWNLDAGAHQGLQDGAGNQPARSTGLPGPGQPDQSRAVGEKGLHEGVWTGGSGA